MHPGVLTCAVSGWVDPAAAFASLFGDSRAAFWLDSAGTGHSYMGTGVPRIAGGSAPGDGAALLDEVAVDLATRRTTAASGPLGWVGWLGYELRFATMGVAPSRVSRYPDVAVLAVDRAIDFDHETGVLSLLALGDDWDGELGAWRDSTLAALREAAVPGAGHPEPAVASWASGDDDYLAMVRACQESIRAGDAYQLCLTTEARVDVTPDPLTAYLALRASSPSHHGALLRVGDVSLLSATPEQFLTVTPRGVIESKPIKGTRPRGISLEEDASQKAELLASDKERAENLMIVDLMRNDIARVAEVGSVSVPSLLAVESYAHVHQLVSTVRGQLRVGLSGMDAVRACFPAGSMTGAPKLSATELLDALEQRARGIYSGAFGLFGLDGTIDLAMVIRSIVLDPQGATVGTGGGITALSVPAEELAETRLKAAALLSVLGVEQVG